MKNVFLFFKFNKSHFMINITDHFINTNHQKVNYETYIFYLQDLSENINKIVKQSFSPERVIYYFLH